MSFKMLYMNTLHHFGVSKTRTCLTFFKYGKSKNVRNGTNMEG